MWLPLALWLSCCRFLYNIGVCVLYIWECIFHVSTCMSKCQSYALHIFVFNLKCIFHFSLMTLSETESTSSFWNLQNGTFDFKADVKKIPCIANLQYFFWNFVGYNKQHILECHHHFLLSNSTLFSKARMVVDLSSFSFYNFFTLSISGWRFIFITCFCLSIRSQATMLSW